MNRHHERPTCFISYSEGYRLVMETARHLLEALEFKVDVFDGPDIERPPIDVVKQRIAAADCTLLLLGPPTPGEGPTDPARWPAEEGVIAAAINKPMAIVLHPGTRVPESLQKLQTPVRFDFWSESEFLGKVHHLVKHVLDLRRLIGLGDSGIDQPFVYTRAVTRNRVQRGGMLIVDCYHEVVARQEWSRFHHAIDTGLDGRAAAKVELVEPDSYSIEVTLDPGRHTAAIDLDRTNTPRCLGYSVTIDPPLLPGEKLGYRREFEMKNFLPLTSAEVRERAAEPGFPSTYFIDGRPCYGDAYDVRYDMERITLAMHFPRRIRLRARRVVVVDILSKAENRKETERCNSSECLTLVEAVDSPDTIVSLDVPNPLMNHSYILLYEPV